MSTFFIYRKSDGVIWLALPGMPDNDDFEITGEIYFKGKAYARGIKWQNNDWVYTDSEVPADIFTINNPPERYCYDLQTGEIYENPNFKEEEGL